MVSILISGAGIGGPTLAWWLAGRGFEVTIVERASAFREGGYVIDFWGVGFDVAEQMGIIPRLREVGYRMDRLRFLNDRGGTRSSLSSGVLQAAMGDRFLSIQRGDLARAIFDRVEDRVETRFGDSIAALDAGGNGVEVSFAGGSARHFDLVIAADGLHSGVRTLLPNVPAHAERFLGFVAAAFGAEEYPHREEHTYVSYAEPGRQVSRYALRDGKTAFLLVAASRDAPKAASPGVLGGHAPSAQRQWLRDAFHGLAWNEAPEIFARLEAADDLYFDAVSQIALPAWSSGRVGLLGDAAYSPSLLSGQGAAFAMLGARVLAQALVHTRGSPDAFAIYETQLRPFVEKKQRAARSFAASFTPSSVFGLFVRDQVIRLMNLPGIGGWAMSRMFKDRFELPPAR